MMYGGLSGFEIHITGLDSLEFACNIFDQKFACFAVGALNGEGGLHLLGVKGWMLLRQ